MDSLKYYTDGNRLVYGNGAIMPDIFIPLDTTYNIDYIRKINKKGLINYYSGLYFDKNLEELQNKYPIYSIFDKQFILTDEDYKSFTDIAFEKYKIELPKEDIEKIKIYFKKYTKAYLARNLYKNGSYYKIANETDKVVIKAVEIINKKKNFRANGIHE